MSDTADKSTDQTDADATEQEWSDVGALLDDLKADGYDLKRLTTSTSAPTNEKSVLIEVKR